MNFTYENQGTHTYLVYTVGSEDTVDSMSLGMLTNNRIPGLAQTYFTQMDATKFIKYDVSAKIPVKQFFAGQVNKKRLIGVFNGIVNAMLFAEEYMIDVNSILLDLDYIFADVSTCETVLVCLPIVSDDLSNRDLGTFFKNIMFTTQFDQTESCDHVAKIINYLNSAPVFSLEDFKALLDMIASAPQAPAMPVAAPAPQPVAQPADRKARKATPLAPQQPAQPPVAPAPQPAAAAPSPAQAMPQPAQAPAMPQPAQAPAQPAPGGKKMSMFNLLMNYSKENAELYKAQKAAEKAGQPAPAVPAAPAAAPAKAPGGFAIPGQPAPAAAPAKAPGGFAIPGQPAPAAAPAKAPGGFAVPGQPAPAAAPAKAPGGFAVPGQPAPAAAPAKAPGGFAVPGQPAPVQAPPVPAPVQAAPVAAPAPVAPPAPQGMPHGQPTMFAPPSMPQGQSMNFGETTVLGAGGDAGGTTVLGGGAPAQVMPHLIRLNTQEKININQPVFRIGRERSFVDYVVSNNTSISRSHANIISRNGEYFVMDTNSANHTYVDGNMIQSNAEVRIMHGTKIKLANEDFEFKLY